MFTCFASVDFVKFLNIGFGVPEVFETLVLAIQFRSDRMSEYVTPHIIQYNININIYIMCVACLDIWSEIHDRSTKYQVLLPK